MKAYQLQAIDTLFFRDGRPFNSGETGQMEANGTFPPMPATVVGAVRAALARGHGWTGGPWDDATMSVLGDGDDLGQLRFQGPFLLRSGQPVFPAPLCLLGTQTGDDAAPWRDLVRLAPGNVLDTDAGPLRLPVLAERREGVGGLAGVHVTKLGMQRVLAGQVPASDQTVGQDALWQVEPRVGILRDLDTQTTGEDALFHSSHIRLCAGVSLGAHLDGLQDGWAPATPAALGGESRLAWVAERDVWPLPAPPELTSEGGMVRYTAILITPGDWPGLAWDGCDKPLGDLPGLVVSACVGKPIRMGGWDSLARKPRALKSLLPPGSVWFLKADEGEREQILAWHGRHLGTRAAWGYGQILIGTWKGVS